MRTATLPSIAALVQTFASQSLLIEAAAAIVAEVLPASWSQETAHSPEGEASLVITSTEDGAPTYLITECVTGYELHMVEDDELSLVATTCSARHLAWLIDARTRLEAPAACSAA